MTRNSPSNESPPKVADVEIAICSYRRPELLRQTLDSIARCEIPSGVRCRFIVVNNAAENIEDPTDLVCQSFAKRSAEQHDLVLAHEPKTGHTFARNRAIEIATGDLLIWTDDDVLVDSQWIKSYIDAANQNPKQTFWGGHIVPTFRPERPKWIEENWDNLKGCFAERNLGDQPIEFTQQHLPYGANFAIRTSVQKQFQFDTELGRRADMVLGEDELDLFRRLLESGHGGSWVPESSLQHLISKDRATESYVWDYFVGQGRALVAKQQNWHSGSSRFLGTTIWNVLMWKFKRQFAGSDVWTSHLIRAALAQGQRQALRSK